MAEHVPRTLYLGLPASAHAILVKECHDVRESQVAGFVNNHISWTIAQIQDLLLTYNHLTARASVSGTLTRVLGGSGDLVSRYQAEKTDPNWGYDTYKSIK